MSKKTNLQVTKELLAMADIKIGGKRPQDIRVNNPRFYDQALSYGPLGAGESYMDGDWDAVKLDVFFYKILRARLESYIQSKISGRVAMKIVLSYLLNQQKGKRAYSNAQSHYDIGNDLYEPMLGNTMAYTCAYWDRGAKTLDQAQTDKFDLVCEKLGLKKGMKVLDPGCGWGGLSIYMAKRYGCEVVCFTPAREQIAYIKAHTKGLKVKAKLTTWQDYNSKTRFDRIASIGMLEHVGPKNYREYMTKMQSILKDDGLMLLHTIGKNRTSLYTDPWITRYIFPGGVLPSVKQITSSSEGLFVLEDWHSMGANYDQTLMAWNENFQKSYPNLDHNKYDERFKKMWEYYLLMCAGAFRARKNQLWQVVLSKYGVKGGYNSVR
jgi:cyclopropane-fatty-acyl-phospholipid synthase